MSYIIGHIVRCSTLDDIHVFNECVPCSSLFTALKPTELTSGDARAFHNQAQMTE